MTFYKEKYIKYDGRGLDVRNGDIKIMDGQGKIKRIVRNTTTYERGPKWNKPLSAKVIRKRKGRMS